MRFLSVMGMFHIVPYICESALIFRCPNTFIPSDLVDPQERITELSHLIAILPVANYSLLRALTAHLISVVQHSNVNKMTMRNVGIVFSPTLGIPAGVFSLMLAEFNRVFNVDDAEIAAELEAITSL